MKICHSCNRQLELQRLIARRDACPFCRTDLHCCRNCAFYDSAASKQCREPVAGLVKEKDRANYCDYFIFQEAGAETTGVADQARKALEDLFKR